MYYRTNRAAPRSARTTLVAGLRRALLLTASATLASSASAQVTNLGGGLAGSSGIPQLSITIAGNEVAPGALIDVNISNALPSSPASVMLGFSRVDFPIFGGILVPSPDVPLAVTIDGNGNGSAQFNWPNLTNDQAVYLQALVADAAAPEGFAFTNAIEMRTWDHQSYLRFTAISDVNEVWADVPVQIEGIGGTQFMTSGADGSTETFNVAANQTVIATIGELTTDEGTLLGQTFAVGMDDSDPEYLYHEMDYHRGLPLMLPTNIDKTLMPFGPEPYHDRWSMVPVFGQGLSNFRIKAKCGMLLTPHEIESFENFNQMQFPANDYQLAFNIRVDDLESAVNIDDVNFVLNVDCRGHDFVSPNATPILLFDESQAPDPTLAFDAVVIGFDATTEQAQVWVQGELGLGDNLVLLSRSLPTSGFQALKKYPRLIGGQTGGGSQALALQAGGAGGTGGSGGGGAGGAAQDPGMDCNPTPPAPSFPGPCSSFPPIASGPGCPAPVALGTPACKTSSDLISKVCSGPGGQTGKARVTKKEGGGFTVQVLGVEVTGEMDAEVGTDLDLNLTPGANGKGQCIGYYEQKQDCTQNFRYWVIGIKWYEWDVGLFPFPFPGDIGCCPKTINLPCSDSYGPSQSTCDRTCTGS